ncbi:MAG: DUF3011 domain-containing protein [Gemmatimonadales bacterium]
MLPPFRAPAAALLALFATALTRPPLAAQQPTPLDACRQAVYARFRSPVPYEVTVNQVSSSNIAWRTTRGASGSCAIDRGGRVVRLDVQNEGQPIPASAAGPFDRNSAALACKNEVSAHMLDVPVAQITVVPGETDKRGNLAASWRTAQGAAGTCLVDARGQVVDFKTTTRGSYRPGPSPGGTTRLTCDSHENRRNECPLPEHVEVRLVRVISSNPCLEGRTWGSDDRKIWVTGGCRGEFELRPVRRPGYDVNRPDAAADLQALRACREEVLRRYPGTPNAQVTTAVASRDGQGIIRVNWSMRRGGGGECRVNPAGKVVQFRMAAGVPAGGRRTEQVGPARVQQVTCESQGGARNECAIPSQSRVRLTKVLSEAACDEGRSWGYDSERIWVSGGCRAEFQVETPSR